MKCQVIFLNRFYYPDKEEQRELDKMQEFLSFCHVRFEYESKGLSPDEIKRRKEGIHKKARERLGVVKMCNE